MSEVLLYNSLKQYLCFNSSSAEQSANTLGQILSYINGLSAANTAVLTEFTSNKYGPNAITDPQSWSIIPKMNNPTGAFKVCDTSGYYRCGATCSWTVPAGVSCAQFQIWGAGAGTSTMCCCGGSPFGATGAYATVIIPVTPGDTYTLCAGCAYCCYATMASAGAGCASYVTGNGLTNFCAEGGVPCFCYWNMSIACCLGFVPSNGCSVPSSAKPAGYGFASGACGTLSSCGTAQWNFCYDGATDIVLLDLYTFSCATKFYGSATNGTVYGLSGMYPKVISFSPGGGCCYVPANSLTHISAPVYGFISTSIKCCCFTSAMTCPGCAYSTLYGGSCFQNPGSGGFASVVAAGNSATGGDAGRMGMVCVTYC